MSEQTPASITKDALAQLTGPWVVPPTETQKQRENGILAGELLWTETLESFYRHAKSQDDATDSEDSDEGYMDAEYLESLQDWSDQEDVGTNVPFPLLELPLELRDCIYGFVLLNYRKNQDSSHRLSNKRWVNAYSDGRPRLAPHVRPIPLRRHTDRQIRRRVKSSNLLDRLSAEQLAHADERGRLVPGAKESFQQLKAEHGMYTSRCWHEQDHGPHKSWNSSIEAGSEESSTASDDEYEDMGGGSIGDYLETFKNKNSPAVYINARGNLCDDLPMLALTCRLILSEMWRIIYPSKPDPPTRYRATIRNLNFFPLFRFLQMLNRSSTVIHAIDPATIDIRFDTKYRAKDELLHRNTFQHVKRLVELHWLRDFPLWNCITGLSAQTDAPQNPFTEYMDRVRQIVKLFHIDRPTWKVLTARRINNAGVVAQDKNLAETYWLTQSDSIIVEAAIETLAKAFEYKFGYEGNWSPVGRDGSEWHEKHMPMFMYRDDEEEVAHEREHAVVYVIGKHCEEVDEASRSKLGKGYGKWEREG